MSKKMIFGVRLIRNANDDNFYDVVLEGGTLVGNVSCDALQYIFGIKLYDCIRRDCPITVTFNVVAEEIEREYKRLKRDGDAST